MKSIDNTSTALACLLGLHLLLLPLQVVSQPYGLILDDSAYNALPRQPIYHSGNKAENDVIRQLPKVDLRPYCPTPQHQGAIGSCTGWATGYGAMTILNALRNNWAGKTDTITATAFSALFVYNQVKAGSCDAGAAIDRAAKLLCDKGDILSRDFDKMKNNCDKEPTLDDLKRAADNRIKDYMTLFSTDASGRTKVEKTKLSLIQKKPVVIAMLLRKNFETLHSKDPYWFPDQGDTTFAGAHAMVVVGYDDGKEAFELMNSWGSNWGNGGFVWVKYKDYSRFCCYGFQFVPPDIVEKITTYQAKAVLRKPVFNNKKDLIFIDQPINFNGKYYEPKSGALKPGDWLQLLIPCTTEGTYLYAFSYDTKRKINVHWPRDGQLNDKFFGHHESAVITIADINLPIPDEYGALVFDLPGTEYICLLFAKKPIDQLNGHLATLQQLPTGDFMNNLYKAFDKQLPPRSSINYLSQTAGFSNTLGKYNAVPIVFQIRVRK